VTTRRGGLRPFVTLALSGRQLPGTPLAKELRLGMLAARKLLPNNESRRMRAGYSLGKGA
jgi:hypothetical protein